MASDDSWKRMADLALALEYELQKERERHALAQRTIEMLTTELLTSAETILDLQKQLAEKR